MSRPVTHRADLPAQMLQIEIFENRNRSLLLCGGFPVCQRYTRRQKSLLYSFPLSPSSSGQGRHPFKVDIAGSNPAGGTTAFEQVKACFSSWPVFVFRGLPQNAPQNRRKTPPQTRRKSRAASPRRYAESPFLGLAIINIERPALPFLGLGIVGFD